MKILSNSFNQVIFICCLLFLISCNLKKKDQNLVLDANNQGQIESVFNADSAYAFIGIKLLTDQGSLIQKHIRSVVSF